MNDKNIKILIRFLLFLSVLFCVCLYGITNTYALEKTIYSGNNMGTLSSANTYRYGYISGGVQQVTTASVNTTVSGVAIAFMFYYYEPVALNKTYTMTINFMDSDLLKTFNSSMVHTYSCNSDVCNPSSIVSVEKNNNYGNSNKLTITFNPTTAGTYIYTNLSNSASVTNLTGINTFGIKNVTLDVVDNNQNIIDNQTNNTNNIINNNNSNTQDIINNQNENTQQQIESQKVCKNKTFTYDDIVQVGRLNIDGSISSNFTNWGITDYYEVGGSSFKYFDGISSANVCFYNDSKSLISCQSCSNSGGATIQFPTNTKYIKLSIRENDKPQYFLSVCTNGNQALSDDLNNLNDSLTDSSPVDMSTLGDVAGWLPAGPIDSIINLPLTFMNNLYTALSGTCSALHIPIPYLTNKFIDIPCISTIYGQINGFTTFWNWVGGICSVLILYKYLIALYKYYDDLTTLKANFISDFGGAP